jgi:ABC-type dipeptide/oligopeptide/nickel transport system ATPase component
MRFLEDARQRNVLRVIGPAYQFRNARLQDRLASFITHNLALVRSIAQSDVVLHQGVVAESGQVRQTLEHPADPYTRRLVEDVPKLTVISRRCGRRPAGRG